jgi:hypothetical protein
MSGTAAGNPGLRPFYLPPRPPFLFFLGRSLSLLFSLTLARCPPSSPYDGRDYFGSSWVICFYLVAGAYHLLFFWYSQVDLIGVTSGQAYVSVMAFAVPKK